MSPPTSSRCPQARQGFTLLEILSVLVILGILAAVVVPKYYDLQQEAQNRALLSVKNEAQARLLLLFSKYMLEGKNDTHQAIDTDTLCKKTWFAAYDDYTYGGSSTIGEYMVIFSPISRNALSTLQPVFLQNGDYVEPTGEDTTKEPWIVRSPCN